MLSLFECKMIDISFISLCATYFLILILFFFKKVILYTRVLVALILILVGYYYKSLDIVSIKV